MSILSSIMDFYETRNKARKRRREMRTIATAAEVMRAPDKDIAAIVRDLRRCGGVELERRYIEALRFIADSGLLDPTIYHDWCLLHAEHVLFRKGSYQASNRRRSA